MTRCTHWPVVSLEEESTCQVAGERSCGSARGGRQAGAPARLPCRQQRLQAAVGSLSSQGAWLHFDMPAQHSPPPPALSLWICLLGAATLPQHGLAALERRR